MIFKPVLFGNQILGMVLFFLCVAAFVYLIVNEIVKFCHKKNNVEKGSDEKNSDERRVNNV